MTGRRADDVPLRCGVVLGVSEQTCTVVTSTGEAQARYAPQFPTPHVDRVSPGHLVALARAPDGAEVVVWRWYDAVVVASEPGTVRVWEPAHGEVDATPRRPGQVHRPGTRAYASSGMPGSEWWVAGPVGVDVSAVEVDLDEVRRLYTDHDLWDAALAP